MIADAEAAVLGGDGMPAVVTPSGLPKPPGAQVDECSGADCCAAQVPNAASYKDDFDLSLICIRGSCISRIRFNKLRLFGLRIGLLNGDLLSLS